MTEPITDVLDRTGASPAVELVLPCRDEEEALPHALADLPAGWSVLVVDNGSSDRTADLARELGARVVRESRPGYGAAVHTGISNASAPTVVVCDGDGSIPLQALAELVDPVVRGEVDLVCGRRRSVEPGAWAWHARWGNHILAAAISIGAGTRLHDIAPVRIARRQALLDLGIVDRRFGYPLETLVLASRADWRIVEQTVPYRRRRGGISKVSGSVRGTARALTDFLKVLWRLRRGAPRRLGGDR